jgi:putative peptidoglycan binding protein
MVSIADVRWASYRNLEGPIYRGPSNGLFALPGSPTEVDRIVAVTTAIEGGNYGAVNMYDRGIVSCGLLQFIEGLGQFSVSAMLGEVSHADRSMLREVDLLCDEVGVTLKDVGIGSVSKWRFQRKSDYEVIDTTAEQQSLFYLHSTGEKGTWDSASKDRAMRWAYAIGTVFTYPQAQFAQRIFTADRLLGFASSFARPILDAAPRHSVGRAFKASYLSYAVNNPRWASDALKAAVTAPAVPTAWSQDWLIHVLKYLTFNAKISIYPSRYRALRPVVENLYEINLPDFADELQKWKAGGARVMEPTEIQAALVKLGYDLGPSGVDGKWGPKSSEALLLFEQQHGIPNPDGRPDPVTINKLEDVLGGKA